MISHSFNKGNRRWQIESIPESIYQPMYDERGSFMASIIIETTFQDGYNIVSHREYNKRLYFDTDGNVYKTKTIKHPWFNMHDKES